MDSILLSVKKLLGISGEDKSFDEDIIMTINTVLAILTQLGVGPENGYFVASEADAWSDFIPDGFNFEALKTYVYLRAKLIFDPPLSSFAVEAINNTLRELEWRIMEAIEVYKINNQ